ncbi:DUF4440 domain-containing protein [Devosia yakushimensis]|uniref:DUF4440 domain-containing protein n=1 Tax=Devosia yakushimensis TaxID=470028 RepID=A0ABQ5UFR7_9HYPH|nr:DUF4440 domain-containing protein [Devosia yakushimensis]GLQ10816.1 DUF4440 domain-containing protein [Devosia yakushimensis]
MPLPEFAEIWSLEEALHKPETRRSRQAVENLLAEDFVEFGASGAVYRREQIIDLLAEENDEDSGQLRTANHTLMPIGPDVVLLTYESRSEQSDGSERCVLRSSIWKHNGKQWQMLFHQGTIARR